MRHVRALFVQEAQKDHSNRNLHKEIEMVAEESDLLASLKKKSALFQMKQCALILRGDK